MPDSSPIPAHRRIELGALVAAGGVVGTAARYATSGLLPTGGSGWPTATFTVNVLGALLLGFLLEALVRRGPETDRARAVRLLLGTGVLGSFTTYSSLAGEVDGLLRAGPSTVAVLYALVSVLVGVGAVVLGIVMAAGHHRWRTGELPNDPDSDELTGRHR